MFATKSVDVTPPEQSTSVSYSSVIHIKFVAQPLTLISLDRPMCSLRLPILEAAREAAQRATAAGDPFLARVWGTLARFFETEDVKGGVGAIEALAEKILPEL